MSDDLPSGRRLSAEECERRWTPWSPAEVATRLAGVSAPWCVVAGWALDLFIGETTRQHDDIEIAVPRGAFTEVAEALHEFEWDVVGAGMVWPYPEAADDPELHQTWLRDSRTGRYHLDVFREPHQGDRWICRRDRTITLPYAELIAFDDDAIPYVIPEVALLFKAKAPRPKDDRDFARVVPLLPDHRIARLTEWLTRVHPHHRWLAELDAC
ncbi:hypothetical protein [Nocardia sp. NPDC048505]|uniref:nucleotidyltransferase domain-containing protein n=1 Tax=unclassified Nocardia TaxID=2637762 RepID=UPI00340F308E